MSYQQATFALGGWTPWVKRLIIVYAVGYLAFLVTAQWLHEPFFAEHLVMRPRAVLEGEIWQVVTYQLAFGNPGQFLLDMLALWMFGSLFERRWGARRFLTFYAVASVGPAIACALLGLAVDSLGQMPHFGIDAPVYALLVAYGIQLAETPVYFFGIFPLKGKHLLLIVVGSTLLYALASTPLRFLLAAFGLIFGALLVMGWWRPGRLVSAIRSALLRRAQRRTRRHLRPVDDPEERSSSRWLH